MIQGLDKELPAMDRKMMEKCPEVSSSKPVFQRVQLHPTRTPDIVPSQLCTFLPQQPVAGLISCIQAVLQVDSTCVT